MHFLKKTYQSSMFTTSPQVLGYYKTSTKRIAEYCPYVPGLKFWLDGIYNKDYNDRWVEIFSGAEFTQMKNTFNECSLVQRIENGFYFDGNCGFYNTSSFEFPYNTSTLEITYKWEGTSDSGCFVNFKTANNIIYAPFSGKIILSTGGSKSEINFKPLGTSNQGDWTASVQGLTTGTNLFNTTNTYTYGTSEYLGRNTTYNTIGARLNNSGIIQNSWYIKGTIYCIRIYDRLLTQEEMLYNQQIDVNRFNLTLKTL